MSHPLSRAARRAQRARVMNNRMHTISWVGWAVDSLRQLQDTSTVDRRAALRALGRINKTPVPCSCPMCGNPRKFEKNKTTLAEKKALMALLEWAKGENTDA